MSTEGIPSPSLQYKWNTGDDAVAKDSQNTYMRFSFGTLLFSL